MNKIFQLRNLFILAALVFIGTSCNDEPIVNKAEDDLFSVGGTIVNYANITNGGFYNLLDRENTSVGFDLSSAGESIDGITVMKSLNGGDEVELGTFSSLPSILDISLAEAVEGLGVTIDDVMVGDVISYAFVMNNTGQRSGKVLQIPCTCPSDLGGTYAYESLSYWCGEAGATGEITFTAAGGGEYELDEWSFGGYPTCYDGFNAASWGTLRMKDLCQEVSILGEDNYTDTWSWTIDDVSGRDMTVTWMNTYGEGGQVKISRTEEQGDWPALFTN